MSCLPPPQDTTLVSLSDGKGTVIKSKDIWATKPGLILVIRRPGWGLCREQASVVLKQKPVLDKLGIQITGIVKENIPEEIKSFREDVWPEPLFMDEKLEFYTAVGGGKKNQYSSAGFLATLANPFSKLYKNVITKGKKYKQKTNLVGEGLITGGLYVVHAGGKPEYSFLEKVIGDHVNMTEVMEACEKVAKEAEKASTDAKSKSGL